MVIFLRRFMQAAVEARWWFILAFGALHLLISWMGLSLLGEDNLVGQDFLYYYLTTVTTVGYGDLSPETSPGRVFSALFIMIGGIAVFTAVLGKLIALVSAGWRRNLDGFGDYSELSGAIVVIGFREGKTERLINEFLADDTKNDIVLVTTKEPSPIRDIRQVRADKLTDLGALRRAGTAKASRVVVFAEDDDLTLSACLAAEAVNENCHMTAFFNDPQTAELAKLHVEHLEPVVAAAEELLVRATRDPGASRVLSTLVSATDQRGALFSVTADQIGNHLTVETAQANLRQKLASLLAIETEGGEISLCFDGAQPIGGKATLFYVAERRLAFESTD